MWRTNKLIRHKIRCILLCIYKVNGSVTRAIRNKQFQCHCCIQDCLKYLSKYDINYWNWLHCHLPEWLFPIFALPIDRWYFRETYVELPNRWNRLLVEHLFFMIDTTLVCYLVRFTTMLLQLLSQHRNLEEQLSHGFLNQHLTLTLLWPSL